jgi:hypothetical protein
MNTARDTEAVLGAWLDEGPEHLPRDTRQAILVGVRTLPRRSRGIAWPTLDLRRNLAMLSGAVALVIVAVVATSVYFNNPNVANPSPTPSASPTTPTPGGMWPQTSLEEVLAAQAAADAGDPAYTWQVDPLLEQHSDEGGRSWMRLVEGQPAIVDRFLRGVLGWDEYIVNVYAGRADGNGPADGVYSDIGYLRCAPGEANRLQQSDTCKPTLDDLHYETVSVDLAQLDRRAPDGIWVVSGWRTTEPYAPVAAVTALVESFLQARIEGQGAEALVYPGAEATEVPLLYATTTGSRYERYEIELVRGPLWAAGYMDFQVRLFADGGQTVVEQEMRWVYWSPQVLMLWPARTTENGQPVAVRYGFLDGVVTAFAQYPWQPDCGDSCLGLSSATGYIEMGEAPPSVNECLEGATDPVSVSIGDFAALAIDGRGAAECGVAQIWLGTGKPVRFYLIDLPDGSSVRTLAITVIAEGVPLNSVIEATTPIIESIEFHMP